MKRKPQLEMEMDLVAVSAVFFEVSTPNSQNFAFPPAKNFNIYIS
jgi:hypothetical protein